MDLGIGKFSITIRMTVVCIFVLATLLTATVAVGIQYYFGHRQAQTAATGLYTATANNVALQLNHELEQTTTLLRLLAENERMLDRGAEATQLRLFADLLRRHPRLYGIYLGRPDGSLLELINLNASEIGRNRLQAVPGDRWVVVRVQEEGTQRQRSFTYLDENFQERVSRLEPTDYDVRERNWYRRALASRATEISEPYLFAQLAVAGLTTSRVVTGSGTVLGIDRTLSSMADFLDQQEVAGIGEMFLYRDSGELIASTRRRQATDPGIPLPELALSAQEREYLASLPTLTASNEMDWPPFDYALLGEPRGLSIDVVNLLARMLGLSISYVNGLSWPELVDLFRKGQLDLLHSTAADTTGWGIATNPYHTQPFALVTRSGEAKITALAQLEGRSLAIPQGWTIATWVRQRFPTIRLVTAHNTLDAMQRVLAGEAYAALDNLAILRYVEQHYFLAGLQYHREPDFGGAAPPDTLHIVVASDRPQLAALLNKAIAALGPAQHEAVTSRWLAPGATYGVSATATVPHDTLVRAARDPALRGHLLPVRLRGEDTFAYSAPVLTLGSTTWHLGLLVPEAVVTGAATRQLQFAIAISAGLLLLLLPLSWSFASPIVRPIRQLALENSKIQHRRFASVRRVASRVREIDELSSSMVGMVQAIQTHETAQRELMDAFIQLIAQAIDDKSPYTGGHCARVPELAMMLARHASNSTLPAFRDFQLEGEEQWREYRVAAWLHDCGKITTPEHIVDKGSKLEAIHNRIHEVRMRFEVLWREAEIDYLRQRTLQPTAEVRLRERRDAAQQQLRDDFAFVAACNIGGEYLDPAAQQRLQQLGKVSWTRHFDNRIGLSPVEELRVPTDAPAPPVQEPLLADRPEHIIAHARPMDYPPEYGIDMDIPQQQYNLGEIYNLSVSRGTLTTEDRFKINEHMISTIKMLESLPFPDDLKNVPRYASTHHETLRGTGYPRRLSGPQLSIPERLLAIADIFEALTAGDRPYKKAKTVGEALGIMRQMVADQHIDSDCFELFVRERIYLEYGRRFLAPEQLDHTDPDPQAV